MPRLNQSFRNDINVKLDQSSFTASDFAIDLVNPMTSPSYTLYLVEFIPSKSYVHIVSEMLGKPNTYKIDRSPGGTYESETFEVNGLPNTIEEIPEWCADIRNELKASSNSANVVDLMRAELQKQIEEHLNSSSSAFSLEEILELQSKLDKLTEDIVNLQVNSENTNDEIEKLKQEISDLRDDLELYPKDVWLKTAGNKPLRIASTLSRSKEFRELAMTAVNSLMPGPGSSS